MIAAPAASGARRRRRGCGQDRDDGRARRLAGGHGRRAPRAGPRPDVHPQGRPAARRRGSARGCAGWRARACSTSSTPAASAAPRCSRASRPSRPTTPTPAGWSPSTPCGCPPSPRAPAAGRDGVVAARAPGGQHLGRRARRRRAARHRHRRWLLALAGELGEHLVEPDAVRAHAERIGRGAGGRAARQGPAGRAVADLPARGSRRSACGWRCCRWWRRSPRASGPSARSTSPTSSPSPPASPTPTPRSARPSAPRYRAVLLDEYQDTGHAQRVLLRALFGTRPGDPVRPDGPTVTAVGDPCQSIYGWRGASAANLARFRTDFPAPDGPADQYGLLTSFRNPSDVLRLANTASAPLPGAAARAGHAARRCGGLPRAGRAAAAEPPAHVDVGELRPAPDAPAGDVRVALLPDVAAEVDWMADAVADAVGGGRGREAPPPTSAVLVRRRVDMDPIAAALRARGLPVEVVGLGGLLDTPEVRDLVSALRLVADPLAGPAAVRLLTGARWRLGVADLAALWARARELVPPPPPQRATRTPTDLALGALPGEQAEQAGLVDALDDPGPATAYSPDGFARIAPPRPRAGLAARPGGRPAHRPRRRRRTRAAARRRDRRPPRPGRPRAPRRVRRRRRRVRRRAPRSAHPARAARLPPDRRAGRGRAVARARSRSRPTASRCSPCTPRRAWSGRSWPCRTWWRRCSPAARSAAPGSPARPSCPSRCAATSSTSPTSSSPTAATAGPARTPSRPTPRPSTPGGWSRSGGCSTWRSPGPSGCCCSPGTAGPPPARSPGCPRSSSPRSAEAHGARDRGPRSPPPTRSTRPPSSRPPRSGPSTRSAPARADVQDGRRAGPRRPARPASTPARPPPTPAPSSRCSTSNRRPSPRRRTRRAGPPTSTCCSPNGPPPARARPRSCPPSSP